MKRSYLLLFLVMVVNLMVWMPFVTKIKLPGWNMNFSDGTKILWQNYDGPNYLIVAKSWYNKNKILNEFSNPLPAEYYPAHFPLFPAVISFFDIFLKGPTAMLLSTLTGSLLCFFMFWKYATEIVGEKKAFALGLVFLIFPFRWLALRAVGSPEPWFIFFVLASLYSFKKEKYLLTGVWGALAMFTKSPAILLFGAYGISFLIESIKQKRFLWRQWPLMLMPAALLGLFYFYSLQTGNFWAYFQSGDNFHLFWPPFSIFAPQGQYWVGNFWLEDILWLWLFYGIGVMRLREKKLSIEHLFAGLFFFSTLFVAHRDVSRYILPIAPLVLIGWEDMVEKKEFKYLLVLLIIPTLLFTWNFLLHNTAPVADWAPYL